MLLAFYAENCESVFYYELRPEKRLTLRLPRCGLCESGTTCAC